MSNINNNFTKIYYENTDKFTKDDWYFAFREINRLLQLKTDEYKEELKNIDTEKMTDEMKKFFNAMIYVIKKENFYDEYKNLEEIKKYNEPMKNQIILEDDENCVNYIDNKLSERNIYIYL